MEFSNQLKLVDQGSSPQVEHKPEMISLFSSKVAFNTILPNSPFPSLYGIVSFHKPRVTFYH